MLRRSAATLPLRATATLPLRPTRRAASAPPPLCRLEPSRPSLDDVQRISEGKAARTRGWGSRQVPHRLNQEERSLYDRAKERGFLTLRGTGYRKERKGSPCANIWRQLSDAKARPCILVEQGPLGDDVVTLDLSTLRTGAVQRRQWEREALRLAGTVAGCKQVLSHQPPFTIIAPVEVIEAAIKEDEEAAAVAAAGEEGAAVVRNDGNTQEGQSEDEEAAPAAASGNEHAAGDHTTETVLLVAEDTAEGGDGGPPKPPSAVDVHAMEAPIWQQPPRAVSFSCDRNAGKALAKLFAHELQMPG
jgi:hypothetical protein